LGGGGGRGWRGKIDDRLFELGYIYVTQRSAND